MTLPTKLIHILSEHTAVENMNCEACKGAGEITVFDSDNGYDFDVCDQCLGSGYNQLGMIIKGILKPPEEGFGPEELQAALKIFQESQTDSANAAQVTDHGDKSEWTVVERAGYFTLEKIKKIS